MEKNNEDKIQVTLVWKGVTYSLQERIEQIIDFDDFDIPIGIRRRTEEELKPYVADMVKYLITKILMEVSQ